MSTNGIFYCVYRKTSWPKSYIIISAGRSVLSFQCPPNSVPNLHMAHKIKRFKLLIKTSILFYSLIFFCACKLPCAALNNKRSWDSAKPIPNSNLFPLERVERGCVFAVCERGEQKCNFVLISLGINIITQGRLLLFLSGALLGEMLSGDACPEAPSRL